MELSTLWLFVGAAIVLIVVPGPSVFYIIARSINQGKRTGMVSVLGVSVGSMVHILAAAIGISALLMTSSVAFNVVKYLGAAYLIYLGCKTLFFSDNSSEPASNEAPQIKRKKRSKVFYQSIVVEALNPKVALFFLALFPQFISPEAGSVALQFFVLGVVFIVIGIISDGMYVLLASAVRQWLLRRTWRMNFQNWLTGATYIVLGICATLATPTER